MNSLGQLLCYDILSDFLELKTETVHLKTGDTFLQGIVPTWHEQVMFLLFMGAYATSLMKKHNNFDLFDEQGLSINCIN